MIDSDTIKYVIGPSLVAIVTAIPILYKVYTDYKVKSLEKERFINEEKERNLLSKHVVDVSKVYEVLQDSLIKIPTINRIVIIRAVPSPINPKFLTVIYEVVSHGTPTMRDVVQKMPVDTFHRDYVILPLIRDGKVVVDRETSNGHLKDIYEAYNHSFSKCYTITANEDSLTYIVFSFSEGTLETTPPLYREAMRGQLNKLMNIFKNPNEEE